MDVNSISFKLVAAPLSCIFFDSIAVFLILDGNLRFAYAIPLILLNIVILCDIFSRKYSESADKYSHKILALAFLAFPLAVALPYFENIMALSRDIHMAILIIGCGMELFGGYLIIHSRHILGTLGTVNISIEDTHALVKRSFYKYIRNPMYDGFLIMMFGYCFAILGLISIVIVDSTLFLVLNSRAKLEERLLEERFGEEYRLYKKGTGRYIPRLKRDAHEA